MVLIIPALIGAGGAIAGAVGAGAIGANSAANLNAQNREFAAAESRTNRQFNADEALLSRNWQERMSNTAYQRTTKDMKAAGINPMLAYMQGGASTSGGATASGSPASTPGTETPGKYSAMALQGAAQSAVDAYRKSHENRVSNAQVDQIKSNTALINAKTQTERQATLEMMSRTYLNDLKADIMDLEIPTVQKKQLLDRMFHEADIKNFDQEYGRNRPLGHTQALGIINQGVTKGVQAVANEVERIKNKGVKKGKKYIKKIMNYKSGSKYNNKPSN